MAVPPSSSSGAAAPPDGPTLRRIGVLRLVCESLAILMVVCGLLLSVARDLPAGWDEGYVWERIDALQQWAEKLRRHGWSEFTAANAEQFWRFSRKEPDGHGPFYALLSCVGHWLSGRWLPPPLSYRVGSIALFAFAAACVYATLRDRFGPPIALVTLTMMAALPRSLPELCYGLVDGPLLSLSLVGWCGFVLAVERRHPFGVLLFGVALGLAMATKLTGWFLPMPYFAWTLVDRRVSAWRTLLRGGALAIVVVFAVNVGWWFRPALGVVEFFRSNLTRDLTRPISILFMGQIYPFSLPWYNTLVWMSIAVPVGVVLLGSLGVLLAVLRARFDRFGLLLVLNWTLLMVVRALPQAPGHDGTRQINIAFAFLALLAGYGLAVAATAWRDARWRRRIVLAAGIAAAAECVVACVAYHPNQLSYYSPVIGNLTGAERAGFEPTYFWDSVTADVADWLRRNTSERRRVLFGNYTPSFRYMQKWGHFQFAIGGSSDPLLQWYVMQHRPGIYKPEDRWLLANRTPAFAKRLGEVTLLSVFPIEDFSAARQAIKAQAPNDATR